MLKLKFEMQQLFKREFFLNFQKYETTCISENNRNGRTLCHIFRSDERSFSEISRQTMTLDVENVFN